MAIRAGHSSRCLSVRVYVYVQGLLIPQGLDLGCYEQMVIIRKAQRAVLGSRGVERQRQGVLL